MMNERDDVKAETLSPAQTAMTPNAIENNRRFEIRRRAALRAWDRAQADPTRHRVETAVRLLWSTDLIDTLIAAQDLHCALFDARVDLRTERPARERLED